MPVLSYPDRQLLSCVDHPVDAVVAIPGSKSITNRALILAALANGDTELINPLVSDDTKVMGEALARFGVEITNTNGNSLLVCGRGGRFKAPGDEPIFIGNSGTSVRFLTAAAALLPEGSKAVLDGVPRMRERPIRDLLFALTLLGVKAVDTNNTGCPPVEIHGGGLPGGACGLNGSVSSQYLTALLQVAPLAKTDVHIHIVGTLISRPYIDLTQKVIRDFGADFSHDNYETFHIPSSQQYTGRPYEIEADASSATYFMAAAAVTGGTVRISNLYKTSAQGDVGFAAVLEKMGCIVKYNAGITVTGPKQLKAIDVDLEAMPDTAMTLAAAAVFADGPSHITGLSSLKVKETDRLTAIATELRKVGVSVEFDDASWTITPPPPDRLKGALLETYDDHRMAMALAVLGLRIPNISIDNPSCVAKTFPDFWIRWNTAFRALAN